MSVVYQHIRKDTNEIFYVGIGSNIQRAYDTRRKKHWKSIVHKHGYDVVILYKDITWEEACIFEIDLIDKIGRQDLGTGPLVNLTNGGEGASGRVVSESTRQLAREKQTGRRYGEETKQKLSKQRKGKKKPDDFGGKISNLQKERGGFFTGHKHTDESKKKTSEKVAGEKNPFYGKKHTEEIVLGMSGPNSSSAKLSAEQVLWIRNNYIPKNKEYGCNALARRLNVSSQNISNIINYKSYINV